MSHAHEDHVAGIADCDVPVCIHEQDLAALRSQEVMVNGYGLPPDATERTHAVLRDHFTCGTVPMRSPRVLQLTDVHQHLSRYGRLHGLPGR